MMSRYYADVASAINETAANLRQITLSSEVQSEAVEAFSELARTVASSVNEIDNRYGVVSSALQTYGGELSRVRDSAWSELVVAEQHRTERTTAHSKATHLENLIHDPATPPANLPYLNSQLQARYSEIDYANSQIASATARVQQLVAERAAAAQAAAALIEDECRGSDLNDGVWDKVANFASEVWNGVLDVLESLVDLIDMILPILDILSTLVAILMIVLIFTGVGIAVVALIALIIAGTALLLKEVKLSAQVVLAKNGRCSWAEVGKSAIDVAFGVVDVALAATGLNAATAGVRVAEGVAGQAAKTATQEGFESLTEYMVRDRAINGYHELFNYSIDASVDPESVSFGDVVSHIVITGGERETVQAIGDLAHLEGQFTMSAANAVYQQGAEVVDTLGDVAHWGAHQLGLGELVTAGLSR